MTLVLPRKPPWSSLQPTAVKANHWSRPRWPWQVGKPSQILEKPKSEESAGRDAGFEGHTVFFWFALFNLLCIDCVGMPSCVPSSSSSCATIPSPFHPCLCLSPLEPSLWCGSAAGEAFHHGKHFQAPPRAITVSHSSPGIDAKHPTPDAFLSPQRDDFADTLLVPKTGHLC